MNVAHLAIGMSLVLLLWAGAARGAVGSSDASLPLAAEGIEATLFARDPLVRNPCALTFDARGRLCVGMGPQYRNPTPETPGDSVWILLDRDGDGAADDRLEFASGFNAIQGLAWHGGDLWVANAPDLTVVRDVDGDDRADRYTRVFSDLGNLEHGLHGLRFGPDGKLYLSKGNSKGLTILPDRVAPRPFRELWGVEAPGAPDFPEPVTADSNAPLKRFHDPSDDWGATGGILRCDPDGSNLEIVARGFRNPWDIDFDASFTWLGTDNDQTLGDKIFAPFFGAHFGWGHPWSYDWKGDDHLPTAPSSGPLFEGSGTGVAWLDVPGWPEPLRGVWLINDWLRREVLVYRPKWRGAWLQPAALPLPVLAHAGSGRSMPMSAGRAFDPVDLEVGPDGAVYLSSWGREYGAVFADGEQANEGRLYRIAPEGLGTTGPPPAAGDALRGVPHPEWPLDALLADLGSHLPAWRTDARAELVRRGDADAIASALDGAEAGSSLETWLLWTLAAIDPARAWSLRSFNARLQSLRVQGSQPPPLRPGVAAALGDPEPRLRLAAVLALHQAGDTGAADALVGRAAVEDDRIVWYALWQALRTLMPEAARRDLLTDARPAVRRAALLSLLEDDGLAEDGLRALARDPDPSTAALAAKRLGGRDAFEQRGRPLVATTGDGRDAGAAPAPPPAPSRAARRPVVDPVSSITASSGNRYRTAVLEPGVPLYTDRGYRIRAVPEPLLGETLVRTANADADPPSGIEVAVELRHPSTVYLADDARGERPPAWMRRDDWEPTDLILETDDPRRMRLFRREVPAGRLVLGTNREGVRARKGNYVVVVVPHLLAPPPDKPTTAADVLPLVGSADPARGRDLFLSRHGAHCAACHRLGDVGNAFAPDLSDIGSRADATLVLRAILEPSAEIVEGFGLHQLVTKSGAAHAGTLVAETGRSITLATVTGDTVTIEAGDVAERRSLPVSPMPATFGAMMTAADLADLVAFLLTLTGAQAAPPALATAEADDGRPFTWVREGDALHLDLGNSRVATWLIDDPVLTRRAFVNVRTPSGIPVTRPWPAPESEDHAVMHPGIWISFGWLSGNDYWRLQSEVAFEGFLEEPSAEGAVARFAVRNRYVDTPSGRTVCLEDTGYRFERVPEGVVLEVDAMFFNDERAFAFGDQEESGLAVRLARPLTVEFGNGRILNDRGDRDGAGTWGKPFRWIDYSGTVDGREVGLLVVPHPDNPRPSWAHSRDYGALVANPFPRQPKERREPYVTTPVAAGEQFRLRYTILIHETLEGTFDPAAAAARRLGDG